MRLMEQFGQRKYNEGKQEGEQNGEKRGEKKGSETTRWEIAGRLVNDNMSVEKVSEMTDIPVNQLELFNGGK